MYGQFETFNITDASGVGAFVAVVQDTAAGNCKKPAAANADKFVGITQDAQANQNKSVRVQVAGRTMARAKGVVAVGDLVQIGDTTGRLQSCQTDAVAAPGGVAANIFVVGRARTAAAADDDLFEVQIGEQLVKVAAS